MKGAGFYGCLSKGSTHSNSNSDSVGSMTRTNTLVTSLDGLLWLCIVNTESSILAWRGLSRKTPRVPLLERRRGLENQDQID